MTEAAQRRQRTPEEEARAMLEAEEAAINEAQERSPVLPSVRNSPLEAAQMVLERFFTKDGLRQFVYYRESWYSYFEKLWSERSEDDVTHFLHRKLQLCRMINADNEAVPFNCAQRNLAEIQYQIQNLVSIPSHYNAPCVQRDNRWHAVNASGKIVCRGQIVDMMTGDVASNHHMFVPNGAEWEWDAEPEAPVAWMKFLRDLFGEKTDEISMLQEWFGYMLSGDTWAHKGLIIVGPPRGGKGTIGHILTRLLGSSMVASPALHALGKDFGLQPLLGKRMCLISDARLSSRADTMAVIEMLLRITAGDAVDVGRKHKSSVQTVLESRVVMLSNEMPQLADGSEAINSRFLILALEQSFLGREDPNLLEDLTEELPGIAAWAVEGYRRLRQRRRFEEPQSSARARTEWYEENNPLEQFVQERCVMEAGAKVEATALYEAYKSWADDRGLYPLAANQLSRKLASMYHRKIEKTKSGSTRFLKGIGLLESPI